MNRWTLVGAAGLLVFSAGGCVNRQAQKEAKLTENFVSDPVRVVTAQPVGIQTLVRSLEITGQVETSNDTQVGAKTAGRLMSVAVRDGDPVSAGQVLATIESATQLAQLQQALAASQQAQSGLQAAQSQLAQTMSNAALSPARTSAAVRQAEAALKVARAQLLKAQNGARPEERRQVEASVAAAKTNLENQERELARVQRLVSEGAVAANRVDQLTTAVAAARAQYETARQSLNMLEIGTRAEDLASARAQVQQAEEGLRSARAQKSLDVVFQDQVNAARAQVSSARAGVQAAQAQVALAQQNLSETVIRAPFAGRVQGKPVQAGTVIAAGTPVVRLVGVQGVYFAGQVPEASIADVTPGRSVEVWLDAVPNRRYAGVVSAASPQGSSVGRLFNVRVQLVGDLSGIQPGMFARGKVQLKVIPGAEVVPATAVLRRGETSYVYVVDGEKAKEVPVQVGFEQGNMVQVTGIPVGSKVVVKGQTNLVEGSLIRLEAAPNAKAQG